MDFAEMLDIPMTSAERRQAQIEFAKNTWERTLSCRDLSQAIGGDMSEEEIRAACLRGEAHHPLPCYRSKKGHKTCISIRYSRFLEWYAEEEDMR